MANLFWSGVAVSFQSALAASVAITGITQAAPGVLAHGGPDPSNGDYVLLTVEGMTQVNSRVFRVANVAAGTFELEGEDTTDYGAFTSGSFEVITFGNSLSTITGVNVSGGEPNFVPTTTIHDLAESEVPTTTSPIGFAMTSKFAPGNSGLTELAKASKTIGRRCFMFTFRDGAKLLFNGHVSFPNIPTGQTGGLVESPLNLRTQGLTVYAS